MDSGPAPLRFTTHEALRQRLVLSTLTGRPVRISQIRASSPTHPGLAEHEISFLRLLESITNGSVIEISYTGTTLLYRPGLITGCVAGVSAAAAAGANASGNVKGGVIRHEVPAGCTRGISYFLLPLCMLAPFSKAPVNVLFTGPGVTTSATPAGDLSADSVRTAILPLYAHFGITLNIEVRIIRRASLASDGKGGGNGEVRLSFGHQVRLPKTIHLLNPGRVKRVRGVAYCIGVSGSNNARMIETARGVLNPLVGDTYIFSDVSSAPLSAHPRDRASGATTTAATTAKRRTGIGFGLSLVAETSTGTLYSADVASAPEGGETPDDLGRRCAYQLLETISMGGCVPLTAAPTVLVLMAMGSEDVGRVRLGRDVLASPEIIGLGRDLRKFGANAWGVRDADDSDDAGHDLVLSVVGKGIGNVGRKMA